ncbi:MAG: hypothetical protein DRP35_03195 [Candidatus Zixiibacteriota bacterium]|nr:MAG: hypothetical protein DRP35_03195 [candidate division Zixibacteria bacterium]
MFDTIFTGASSWFSLIGSAALLLGSFLTKKYIIPFLSVGKRKQFAQYIALIADEVTDDLRKKYPQNSWLKHLDEAIDVLVDITGVAHDIASRAVNAAVNRK